MRGRHSWSVGRESSGWALVIGLAMGLVMMVAVGVRAADAAAASPDPDQRRVPPRAGPPAPQPDFWFGQPRGAVRVHVSRLFAREGSDLFSFLQEQFTIDGHAFDATVVGTEVGVRLTPRASVLFGVDVSRALNPSEYRDFVDSDGIAIVQDTRLTEVNLSTSLKFALTPPGRQISRLAWIPHPITPYVGAGGGALWYRLEQQGEFVDFVDLSIFDARFRSTGWTPSAHVFGGADVNLWKRVFLGLEARYVWADAPLGRDFTGFEPIDLTGLKLTVGATVAF